MFDLRKKTDNEVVGPQKDVDLNKRLYDRYREGNRSTYVANIGEDKTFVEGLQWSTTDAASQKAAGWPALPDYGAKAAIDQLVAMLTSNRPRFSATARENSDVTIATHASDLMAWIWDISTGNVKLKRAIYDYQYAGMGALVAYIDPYADYGKGEVKIDAVDPEKLFIDPNSEDPMIRDAAHVLISEVKTGEQLQAIYPKFDFSEAVQDNEDDDNVSAAYNAEDQIIDDSDYYKEKYRIIDRYSKVQVPYFNVFDPFSDFEKEFTKEEYDQFLTQPAIIATTAQGEEYITEPKELQKTIEIIQTHGDTVHLKQDGSVGSGVAGIEDVVGSTTRYTVTSTEELVNKNLVLVNKRFTNRIQRVLTIGDLLVFKSVIPIDSYPIVTFMANHKRKPFPTSNIRIIRPYVEQIIKFQSLLVEHTTRSTNVTILIQRGSHDIDKLKKQLNLSGAQVIEIELELDGGKPVIIYPQALSNELFAYIAKFEDKIREVLGVHQFMDGSMQGAHPTRDGFLAQNELGMNKSKATRDDIEEALNQLGRVTAQMFKLVYTERKLLRLQQGNQGDKTTTLNDDSMGELINDVQNIRYDIQVVSGSMLPSNRWARTAYYLDLHREGIMRDTKFILEESEVPREVIEREDILQQQAVAMQQMEERIKQLEGDAQTSDRELKTADRQVSKSKFDSRLKSIEAKIDANANLAGARMNDQVKKVVKATDNLIKEQNETEKK